MSITWMSNYNLSRHHLNNSQQEDNEKNRDELKGTQASSSSGEQVPLSEDMADHTNNNIKIELDMMDDNQSSINNNNNNHHHHHLGQVDINNINLSSKASPPSLAGTTAPTSEDDNMDFDSDDDDDSKSNHSNSNRSRRKSSYSSANQKGDMKRSHHNVLERKRRDLIKDSFTKLREIVPTLSNERASRAQILKKAADFIQMTNQKNDATRSNIEELMKKNSELEEKISAAAQVKTGASVAKQEPATSP